MEGNAKKKLCILLPNGPLPPAAPSANLRTRPSSLCFRCGARYWTKPIKLPKSWVERFPGCNLESAGLCGKGCYQGLKPARVGSLSEKSLRRLNEISLRYGQAYSTGTVDPPDRKVPQTFTTTAAAGYRTFFVRPHLASFVPTGHTTTSQLAMPPVGVSDSTVGTSEKMQSCGADVGSGLQGACMDDCVVASTDTVPQKGEHEAPAAVHETIECPSCHVPYGGSGASSCCPGCVSYSLVPIGNIASAHESTARALGVRTRFGHGENSSAGKQLFSWPYC